ncbi:N-acetylglucosamine kinase [Synechococcus sp. J7-Johnson]|uniref:N-acetylglucosamine kinase n=1 Tax=Synechococcus sp. J7-Johnson TaxID=2823737 RepID=UPI0020CFA9EC|nr:BadF/BadG/BcrA/BcrD ATPase family protein [Synechococcus sp. J7-Johnson]MCP9840632.1 N-acetylglucosamine kinase [Synechococcus sp. J7-Johnson]
MTEPVLLAGFDAGQTHTTCRLALRRSDGSLQVLAEGEGPGVSHLAAAAGEELFTAALTISLERARATATHTGEGLALSSSLQAAAVGASGIEQGSAVQQLGTALAAAALGLPLQRVLVNGDERTALHGAFGGRAGIVVISGTGCIALGRNAQGDEHRCGGWGWLLDRSGSACDIGRDALSLSLEMADGRHPDTGLRASLWSALNLDPSDPQAGQRIKAMVVEPGFGAAGFARLAPEVNALAEAEDPNAIEVMERSALSLVELVAGVARTLGLEDGDVCGLGGALVHLSRLSSAYQRRLKLVLPQARLVHPRGDACQGALQLAGHLLEKEPVLSSG